MRARFDSLNRFEVPKFFVCSPGSQYKSGLLTHVLGCLSDTTDEELVVNFNAMSELNFRVNRIKRADKEENAYINMLYNALQNRRLIFVEDVGYFSITDVVNDYSNGFYYKDVRAQSIEVEIQNKLIPYIEDGTYPFNDLLNEIVRTLPMWTIGYVDGNVANKSRTFQDVSVELNALAFLQENMQDAYECIFEFDCVNRQINVYDQNNYVRETQIHLTKNDVINTLTITNGSEDLYTALSVQGDDNLNISPVNPLGTNTIYNFNYYLDWMTDDLRERVIEWQNLVTSKVDEYYELNLAYYENLTLQSNLNSEIDKINMQIDLYQRCRTNIVIEGSTSSVESYNKIIEENGGVPVGIQNELAETIAKIEELIVNARDALTETQGDLAYLETAIADSRDEIVAIHNEVSITSYFTPKEYDELSNYIYEGSYNDEYIAVNSLMTYSEKFQQMKTLYDRAVTRLERVSEPTHEFSMDVENFLFAKEFEQWSEELETGCLINVELDTYDVALLFLSNITVNYEDKTLQMTFGNRFSRFDPKAIFNGVLGDIKKSTNSINYIKEILYPVKEGEFDDMKEAIESSGILTKNAALSSENQEIVIDDTGILGRKLLGNNEYDDKQIKITNQTIVFTDDGWQTARSAIGSFLFNNPLTGEVEEHYGVIANTLIGNLVLSEEVGIYNTDNSITLDKNGFTLTTDQTGPTDKQNVFVIQRKLLDDNGNEYYQKQLYIDEDGNVVLNGSISVFTGTGNGSSSGTSVSLGEIATSNGSLPPHLHIKYSDDGKTFTGNLLANILPERIGDGRYDSDSDVDVVSDDTQTCIHVTYLLGIDNTKTYLFDTHCDDIYFLIDLYDENQQSLEISMPVTNGEKVAIGQEAGYIAVNIICDSGISADDYPFLLEEGLVLEISQMDIRGNGPGTYIGTLLDFNSEATDNFNEYTWEMYSEDVRDEIEELYGAIQSNNETINQTIQDSEDALRGEIKAELSNLHSDIDDKLSGVNTSIITQINSMSNSIDMKYSSIIDGINAELTSHKTELGQYMTYDDVGITLGAITSEFKTVIDNTGMYFKQGNNTVSYVNNNQLHIPNAVIENTLILGNFFFNPRDDGGVSLTWQE